MSTLTTKFSLGDRVFLITPEHETIELPCRFCRGRGWLDAKGANAEARSVKCPDCGVNATVRLGSWPCWRVERTPLQIGQIQLRVYDHTAGDNGEVWENRNPARANFADEERYMAWSTGVGSGAIYRAEDLFASVEEAEEEAEERTTRARAGEPVSDRCEWWPSAEQVRVAAGFLDHRDIYEHDAGHIALAQAIVQVAAGREGRG